MLKSNLADCNDAESAIILLEQLSISLDNKFLKHKHITSNKPKLKRLVKVKSSTFTTGYCSRCKKEAIFDDNQMCKEKEVEVKKEISLPKKVQFETQNVEISEDIAVHETQDTNCGKLCETISESVPAHLQSTFFADKPSIIGNNQFWLPQYYLNDEGHNVGQQELLHTGAETQATIAIPGSSEQSSLQDELTAFLNSIFKETTKKHVRVFQVVTLIDESVVTLTDEYFFKCQRDGNTFAIIDAIPLKDVLKILVNDTYAVLELEVCRAPTLTEFKEFVPGNPEKTESLISWLVYALSRINNFLADVTRLPIQNLPTCKPILSWFENPLEVLYSGVVLAENNFDTTELSEETFMMKLTNSNQFHPVSLLLRNGRIKTLCNGGCSVGQCKYHLTLQISGITFVSREDNPWPNCVRLTTEYLDITLASSNKKAADDLLEKIYICMDVTNQRSIKLHGFIFVTEFSLHIFKISSEKELLFVSPLLNLEISIGDGLACIFDSHGIEAMDTELSQLHSRWRLTFLNAVEKRRFLASTLVSIE